MTTGELTTYFSFLDDLRAIGTVNMFGSPAVLTRTFEALDHRASKRVFAQWRDSFDRTKTPADRAVTFEANTVE